MKIEYLHIGKRVLIRDTKTFITEIKRCRGDYFIVVEWDDGRGFQWSICWDEFKNKAKFI